MSGAHRCPASAKPIIDVDVVIESPALLRRAVEALEPLGYQHEGDKGIAGREAFGREDGSGREWPDHHLYVCARDSTELGRHLRFRNHLRAHPAAATRYEALKRALAERHPDDIESYIEGKSEFVERTLAVDGGGARS